MLPLWIIITTVLFIIGFSLYLIARYLHVHKLIVEAKRTTALPPDRVLSWPVPHQEIVTCREDYSLPSSTSSKIPSTDSFSHSLFEVKDRRLDGLIPASFDAILSSLPSIHDLETIDWEVLDGVRLSAASGLDLESFSNLREYVDNHYFDVGEPDGFLNRLVGYVGEAKAGGYFAAQGAEVTFNEAPNLPGYDISVDGNPVQVKVGGTSETFNQHFEKYPDIPVVTGADNLNIVPEGNDVSFIDSLDADQIHAATEESLDIVNDDFHCGGLTIPTITVLRSSLREINLLVGGNTNISSAAKNVGLDAAGVSVGGWAGAQAGAWIGSLLGPAGSVVVGILGGLGGAIYGRIMSNEVKYADLKKLTEEYQQVVSCAQEQVRTNQAKANAQIIEEIAKHEHEIKRFIGAVHHKLNTKLKDCSHWNDGRCVAFLNLFPKVMERVKSAIQKHRQAELPKVERSSILNRIIWPNLEDIRYVILKRSFRGRLRTISAARSRFAHLASRTPKKVSPQQAIKQIEEFVRSNPFESPDFDHICQQLKQVTQSVLKRQQTLQGQARALCQQEYSKHLIAVRHSIHVTGKNLLDLVSTHAATVTEVKNRLLIEARKHGIDLESSQT